MLNCNFYPCWEKSVPLRGASDDFLVIIRALHCTLKAILISLTYNRATLTMSRAIRPLALLYELSASVFIFFG